jgi:hypothetical protein
MYLLLFVALFLCALKACRKSLICPYSSGLTVVSHRISNDLDGISEKVLKISNFILNIF